MGIEEKRLKLEWISASEGKQFAELIDSFTETIRNLGPSELKKKKKEKETKKPVEINI